MFNSEDKMGILIVVQGLGVTHEDDNLRQVMLSLEDLCYGKIL
jgi:hypothetical protein